MIGRICAIAAVVCMTLFSFASCTPVEFKGTELLMNEKDLEGVLEDRAKELERIEGAEAQDRRIFHEGDGWIHACYVVAFCLAVLSIVVPRPFLQVTGVLGLALVITFMISFKKYITREFTTPISEVSEILSKTLQVEYEPAAWITLAAFVGMIVAGRLHIDR